MEYASNGKGNAALATGIIGTVGTGLGLINGGLGLFGGNGYHNSEGGHYVTKDELDYVQTIASKDQQIAILQSENFTNTKIAEVYERLKADMNSADREQRDWNASQMVANAQMSAAIATNSSSISALQNCCNQITQIKVPNSAVCPGWGAVTITPATSGTTTA